MFAPMETAMKLMIAAVALALIATGANAKSPKTRVIIRTADRVIMQPPDRYFDTAHGPDDPHSLWLAGDYIGRDPDPRIVTSMSRDH
jgi:hypothetical protein